MWDPPFLPVPATKVFIEEGHRLLPRVRVGEPAGLAAGAQPVADRPGGRGPAKRAEKAWYLRRRWVLPPGRTHEREEVDHTALYMETGTPPRS